MAPLWVVPALTGPCVGGLAGAMQASESHRARGQGAQGSYRFDFTGTAGHDAATPLGDRHDPLLTFAMTVLGANKQARLGGHLASFGRVEVSPGVEGTVVSRVTAWLDASAASPAALDELVSAIRTQAEQRAERDGTRLVVTREDGA